MPTSIGSPGRTWARVDPAGVSSGYGSVTSKSRLRTPRWRSARSPAGRRRLPSITDGNPSLSHFLPTSRPAFTSGWDVLTMTASTGRRHFVDRGDGAPRVTSDRRRPDTHFDGWRRRRNRHPWRRQSTCVDRFPPGWMAACPHPADLKRVRRANAPDHQIEAFLPSTCARCHSRFNTAFVLHDEVSHRGGTKRRGSTR